MQESHGFEEWGGTGWNSLLVTFSIKLWLGTKVCMNYQQKYPKIPFPTSTHWVILHIYTPHPPHATWVFKQYSPIREHINFLTLATSGPKNLISNHYYPERLTYLRVTYLLSHLRYLEQLCRNYLQRIATRQQQQKNTTFILKLQEIFPVIVNVF